MSLLAHALRPLRHVIPLTWRIQIKTWIRDRSVSRPGLNRLMSWFIGGVKRPTHVAEADLPPPRPEGWCDNGPHPGPLLTVVIPYYNQGEYLMEALESVWRQTFADFEVVVVNDGSTDPESLRLLETIDEPRTRAVHRENGGLPAARNTGLREARGRHFCCLDSDDALRPTHFEKLLIALESRGCDLAHCDLERFDQGEGTVRGEGFHIDSLLRGNSIGNTATATVRLDAWVRLGGYCESLAGYQDWKFWLDLAAAGCQAAHVPEPLFLYRRHGTSMISRSTRRHRELESQILGSHPELTGDPGRVSAIESARRRLVSRDPFINLGPERHRSPGEGVKTFLLALETLERPSDAAFATGLADRLRDRREWRVIVTVPTHSDSTADLTRRLEERGVPCFAARPMLPEEHASLLIPQLCCAHRVAVLATLGDPLPAEAREPRRLRDSSLRRIQLPSNSDPSQLLIELDQTSPA